jgi:hypothetical protein
MSTTVTADTDSRSFTPENEGQGTIIDRGSGMNAATCRRILVLLISFALLVVAWVHPCYAAIRFDVIGSPTEVIHTGRSEVLGSIGLYVRGSGNLTGTSGGNATLITFTYGSPALQIDNNAASGIRVVASSGFSAAAPALIGIENRSVGGGPCVGVLTLSLLPGAALVEGDYIRIEGVRGRIDASSAIIPGTDLFVDIQAVNDPVATGFSRDRIRIATSYRGISTGVLRDSAGFQILVTEGFARAFVDQDANDDGVNANDRTDSLGNAMAAPANSTQITIRLEGIPEGVTEVNWPAASSVFSGTGAVLHLLTSTYSGGSSIATYSFEAANQAGSSDLAIESFNVRPAFVLGTCGPGHLTATATLGPAVPRAAGCAGPSENAARPRFLESYQPLVDQLEPASTMAGGVAFRMRVWGIGFLPGAAVRWEGVALPTTFVNDALLEVSVSAEMIALAGTATVTVANPDSSGGIVSSSDTFTISAPAFSLFFPRLASSEPGGSEYTGIALVNLNPTTTDLTLTAYDTHGAKITGAGITNPATLALARWQQLPLVDTQIFGVGLSNAGTPGWLQVDCSNADVNGFFMTFDRGIARLDGTDVSGTTLSSFVFPVVDSNTFVYITNPGDSAATIGLALVKADGSVRASSNRTIASHGMLSAGVSEIFAGAAPDATDYVLASSSTAVVAYESFGDSAQDVAALNARDAGTSESILYSPQYVVGGPSMRSMLSVINLDPGPGTVRFRFIADDGAQIGSTRELPIAGRGKILISAQDFFLDAGAIMRQGSVEVAGSGVRLSGSVIFGSTAPGKLLASLPLAPARQARMTFAQIASDDQYYTGLAILNPGSTKTSVCIVVYDRDGNLLAGKVEEIPAGGRISRMLTDYFPAFAGQSLVGGYLDVDVAGPVTAFAVFGTKNLTALAAVPSQVR